MIRRILTIGSILVLPFVLAPAAHASSRVIAQASSKSPLGSVYLSRTLQPSHRYRLEIMAQGHHAFSGNGFQYLVYVANGRLDTINRSLPLAGTTPHSFTLQPPVSRGVSQWAVTVQVALKSGRGLTVRFVDTGRRA